MHLCSSPSQMLLGLNNQNLLLIDNPEKSNYYLYKQYLNFPF